MTNIQSQNILMIPHRHPTTRITFQYILFDYRKVLMGNSQSQKPKQAAAATLQPPRQSSPSKIRSPSPNVNANANPNLADVESLKKSKTYFSKIGGAEGGESNLRYEDYKLTKTPNLRPVSRVGREQDYSVEYNTVGKSRMAGELHSLSFKIDDPDGVSQQAQIYTFDYERTLNHFINWGKQRGDMRSSVLVQSQVQ